MTQPNLFTLPGSGTIELHNNHYVATCPCGAEHRTPADVGVGTAVCTLRYSGWRRVERRWRCRCCADRGDEM
jgi:hypothetical protein